MTDRISLFAYGTVIAITSRKLIRVLALINATCKRVTTGQVRQHALRRFIFGQHQYIDVGIPRVSGLVIRKHIDFINIVVKDDFVIKVVDLMKKHFR